MRPFACLIVCLACGLLLLLVAPVRAGEGGALLPGAGVERNPALDAGQAARLLGHAGPVRLERLDSPVPGWRVTQDGALLGYVGATWEVAGSVGYSGRPLDVLVAVTPEAGIAGAELVRHDEPILTLGISTEDIAAYVGGFAGLDLRERHAAGFAPRAGLPDVISGATVTTGVIRDAVLRTARVLAEGHGLIAGGGGIDRMAFAPRDWQGLLADGALAHTRVSMSEAAAALTGATHLLPGGEAPFLELWAGVLDAPVIGRNLLGQSRYSRIMAALAPGEAALFVASRGLHSHRGLAWRQSDRFDRIRLEQDESVFRPAADDFTRIDGLEIAGAPELKEISVFRLPADRIEAARPFRVVVSASRPAAAGGAVGMEIPLDYSLPAALRLAPAPGSLAEPLWISAWQARRVEIAGVALMLTMLAGILFFQESFVRRPRLWRRGRTAYLAVTLVWLGWIAGGQLSVVQVVAFLQSLLTGFRWETFLIEPVIFLLWGFVALGLLFWGRGVFCGWLCPFGALQELSNQAARRLGVPQIAVPFVLHERLWVIKYVLFLGILALSFYSMRAALVLAEAEPFKTAISMHFLRAWPFVAFAALLLLSGLFIERFYCRYLCPLGAALAIPAKLKLFDWLSRRPQCGRECRLCEQHCTVGAIDPIGRINPNECVLCLRCQVNFHDAATCPVLKRRQRGGAASGVNP
ncbi:protein NirI [Maritimibacter sp. 55A14]|uniref:NosR/NirI family protein n=1 Tax=Maritimibacter sp. 55A14 TaxID=2174844 RepID=UPI000D61D618|nr:NosR/NirI family protein [Maritimibacter sp. 55A14]PWE34349.1 protein NirI [Maritimibacter sp. 55A14]